MIGFVHDTGGAPARKRGGNDCVPRAIAIAAGIGYADARRIAGDAEYEVTRKKFPFKGSRAISRNGVSKRGTDIAMAAAGLVKVKLPRGARPTYSEAHARYGDCAVSTTGHVAAIVGGDLRDTFDGRTYEWEGETRERKAMSVWRKP